MACRVPAVLLLCLAGCLSGPTETALVPPTPFGPPSSAQTDRRQRTSMSPATEEASLRVHNVGQKVIAANPQLKLKPIFSTVGASASGSPTEEIFHSGDRQIVITETLVGKCRTDGELAALLCVELAEMALDRESKLGPAGDLDAEPPPDVRIGGDAGGSFGAPDGTRMVELARFERSHRRSLQMRPDPKNLARVYLTQAGFAADDVDAVAPLLKRAEANVTLEKQMAK